MLAALFLILAFSIWTVLLPTATALGGYLLAASKMDAHPNARGRWYLVGMGIMVVGASISLFNHLLFPSTNDDFVLALGNLVMAAILTLVYLIGRIETHRRVACRLAQIEAM